jgi:hypothetical protein
LSVTDPGRIAYQSVIDMTGKCSGSICVFASPAAPAGHRVVIQHITGIVGYNAAPSDIIVYVSPNSSTFVSEFLVPVSSSALSGGFDEPVLFYDDSGNIAVIQVVLIGNGATFAGDSTIQRVALTGYELDCTVAACSPIATQ